uniref:hypothetical protein n=1 Tax=Thaumasiovibrio occultus TaxID=1891184 RepID=UPI000B35EB6D|nr:hypothetical protein [Thaumasiovibrio occultus]
MSIIDTFVTITESIPSLATMGTNSSINRTTPMWLWGCGFLVSVLIQFAIHFIGKRRQQFIDHFCDAPLAMIPVYALYTAAGILGFWGMMYWFTSSVLETGSTSYEAPNLWGNILALVFNYLISSCIIFAVLWGQAHIYKKMLIDGNRRSKALYYLLVLPLITYFFAFITPALPPTIMLGLFGLYYIEAMREGSLYFWSITLVVLYLGIPELYRKIKSLFSADTRQTISIIISLLVIVFMLWVKEQV